MRGINSEILVQGISSTMLKISLPVFLAVYNLEVGTQETCSSEAAATG